MDGRKNPVILWLADEAGWAYGAIVQNVTPLLPHYEHWIWYMMDENNTWAQWTRLGRMMMQADIIVSMHLMYQKHLCHDEETANVALMLTGPRMFE